MGLVEKHPKDKGKYQSTFDTYGHGKGNGKSRAAVYKYANKIKLDENTVSQNVEEVLKDEDDVSQNVDSWETISWDESDDLPSPTIPTPIRKLSEGGPVLSAAQRATQSKLVRWAYVGLDRALSHWGRGVMQQPEYVINRHPSDYDALEGATMLMMDANGISINLSPNIVFLTVVGTAYAPPVNHIVKNSKRGIFPKFSIKNLIKNPFKRKRKIVPVIPNASTD